VIKFMLQAPFLYYLLVILLAHLLCLLPSYVFSPDKRREVESRVSGFEDVMEGRKF
jgi:hypothetical protein